jgi:hypothetical protein
MRKRIAFMSVAGLLTVGAVWAILAWPSRRLDPDFLAKLAPADAYFYLSIPNDPERTEEFKRSNLHRLIHHPEVQKFVEPIQTMIRDLLKKDDPVGKATGLTLDEIWSLLGGPLGVAVFDVAVESQPMPSVALSISAEDALKIKEAADKVRKKLGSEPGWEAKESVVHGHTVVSLGTEPMGVHFSILGRTIILSPSRPHLEALLGRLEKGAQGSLSQDSRFRSLRKKLAREDRALATAYIGLGSLWKRLKDQVPPDAERVVEATGIRDISAFGLSVEYDLPQIRERYVFLTERQDRGIVKLIAGKPHEDASVRYVPQDASSYSHLNLSLAELYDTIEGFSKATPQVAEGFESGVKEFESRAGFNLRKEFLGKIGPSWTMYGRAAGPKAEQSEMVVIVGLEDPKGFFSALDKMFALGEIKVRREEVQGHSVMSIDLSPKGAPPAGLPPELTRPLEGQSVVLFARDSRLFVGLTADEPAKFAGRVSAGKSSIRENPRFAEVLAKIPPEVDFLTLQDYGSAIGPALEALKVLPPEMMAPLQDPKTGKSFLASDQLPKAQTLKELLGVSAMVKRTEPDAIVVESISDVSGFSLPALAGAGVAAAVLVPATSKAIVRAKATSCANNLSQLWRMQCVYMAQFGGRQKKMPSATGGAFWLALSKTEPPLIDESMAEMFICPLSGQPARPGFTSYRGPKRDVSTLAEGDVVGCCEPGCHPGGSINVLLKSGEVIEVNPGEELYQKALKDTVR